MRIALACNRSNLYPVASDKPEDEFEEFDAPETLEAIAGAIRRLGHEITLVEADRTFPESLTQGRFDFVFNIAEGLRGRCRESQVPAVCEMLGIPYSGSDAITLGITLDKDLAKRVVKGIVPVAEGRLFRHADEIDLSGMAFPLFVKPNAEGSSKGIRNYSRVSDEKTAREQIGKILEDYKSPVLVEEFLEGCECTVGVLGNEKPWVLGIMEIAPKNVALDSFVYSLETKRDYLNQVVYHTPARLSQFTIEEIKVTALKTFQTLECRDFARIDIRLDRNGKPKFLEANPLPGLAPQKSDLVILSRAIGKEYNDLIAEILQLALLRVGLKS